MNLCICARNGYLKEFYCRKYSLCPSKTPLIARESAPGQTFAQGRLSVHASGPTLRPELNLMKRQPFSGKSTRVIVCTSIFVALLMAQPPLAFAVDTPLVVYRLAGLPPAIMFEFGFEADGKDADLLRYAAGTPAPGQPTAYLGTLDTYEAALHAAWRTLEYAPGFPLYIYAIRPTNNFYSVETSLQYARDHLPNPEAREQAADLLRATPRTHEWAARDNIRGDQIMSARRVYLDHGTLFTGEYMVNLNYLYLPPVTNPGPMPVHNASVATANVAEEAQSVFFLPASVNDMGCQKPPQHFSAARTGVCPPLTRLSFDKLRTKFVGRLDASGILSSTVSGQLRSVPGHDEL